MDKRFRRMSESDITAVVKDLDRWASGQLGSKLTWALLEERFGFSRQSLQVKSEIKAAYDLAKQALSGGLVKSRQQSADESEGLLREVGRLKLEIAEYQRKEGLWKQRWQRIAYHIRAKGIQMSSLDKPTQGSSDGLPSERDISNILRPFYKEIPPSGRV